ncbi:hypothetical protein [Thalassomonas sp. RHCl1]|uniref:hypothetical protein n=1 Tax=Thalassomonas sp. RHCl1 TaxID=2995320 RepID=UPI00248D0828|nr:hypothetical protein [Thalassomonas sp. RHCl1]
MKTVKPVKSKNNQLSYNVIDALAEQAHKLQIQLSNLETEHQLLSIEDEEQEINLLFKIDDTRKKIKAVTEELESTQSSLQTPFDVSY